MTSHPGTFSDELVAALAGRYELVREVGRGGMATVYLARDLAHDRDVAIKVMHAELSASMGADRFLREIQLGEKLQHPGVISILDSGSLGDVLYCVMPFIEGESLRDRLDRERQLPLEDAISITTQVAEALAVAHELGIVHRDIKPENILLSGGRAVVADFGIARAVTVAGGTKLTQTGMAIGTPVYMCPEQAAGDRDIDARADQYALACVLYEMLTGQPPFTGQSSMAIMARHALEAVPSMRIVRTTIPDYVDDTIQQAMSKVPADRFPTISAFARSLNDPQAPRRPTAARTALMPARRPAWQRREIWAAAAVLVLALGGWLAFGHRGPKANAAAAIPGADEHRLAILYFQHPAGDSTLGYLADGLSEDLIAQLGRISGIAVISRNGVAPYRARPAPAESIAAALKVGLVVNGKVDRDDDKVRVRLTLIDGPTGTVLDSASLEQAAANPLALRDSLAVRATMLIRRRVGDAVQLQQRRSSTNDPAAWELAQRGDALTRQADSLDAAGDAAGATQAYDEADSLLAVAQARDPKWDQPLVLRGRIAYDRSRRDGADATAAADWVARGLRLADAALTLDPQDPDALELRGTLRYWKWLVRLEPDEIARGKLLADAQHDLEAATRINPLQAGAWAVLSHLYNQTAAGTNPNDRETNAQIAAQNAYKADAYLRNADAVIARLWLSSYDLADFVHAQQSCDEGRRRFPDEPNFVECQVWLMSIPGAKPDINRAWALADTMVSLAPQGRVDFQRLDASMVVAAALARAGLADSARAVARRAAGDGIVDPTRDLSIMQAFVYTLLGDTTSAVTALKTYVAANPDRRQTLAEGGWWFKPLKSNSDFQSLVGVSQ